MKIGQKTKELADRVRGRIAAVMRRGDPETPVNSVPEYKERISRKRKRLLIRVGAAAAAVALVAVAGILTARNWQYGSYKVVSSSDQEDTQSTQYVGFGGHVLKYSGDEVALIDTGGETIWSDPQEMENPVADICGDSCVVYDKNGRTMAVYNSEGRQGFIETSLPIMKARTASQGVVAAILEDGETTWINFYDKDGSEIATGKTSVDSPGYPVDLDVSENGLLIGVAYLTVADNQVSSYVAFYNFGNTGQNQMDNMVSGYTYDDVVAPRIYYMDASRAAVLRDDGFVLYQGRQIPEETKTVQAEGEIVSTFFDERHLGLVYHTTEGEDPYWMVVYDAAGNEEFSQTFDFSYDNIQISQDQIIMYNSNEFAIYTMYGVCRYQGSLKEGSIQNIFRVAGNRYMVIMENGIQTIKLG